jgi:galactokinase
MAMAGYNLVGLDILYDCTVPFGAGLSSSAAIEVATAYALAVEGGNKVDKRELALLSQKAENLYAGVNCGIMDQYASANGKKNCAVLLDCAKVQSEFVPLELGDYVLVLTNCNKPHSLVESKYNERRAEVETALNVVQKKYDVENLASTNMEMLNAVKGELTEVVYRRAKHVVEECERVRKSVRALQNGDLVAFGKLLNASHASLRDQYEVTGKELDTLAGAAQAQDGCLGSRMTGAGFGGSTVSVVKKDRAQDFEKAVGEIYEKEIGYAPSFFVAEIEDGIRVL